MAVLMGHMTIEYNRNVFNSLKLTVLIITLAIMNVVGTNFKDIMVIVLRVGKAVNIKPILKCIPSRFSSSYVKCRVTSMHFDSGNHFLKISIENQFQVL